jgi:hypothetical protein
MEEAQRVQQALESVGNKTPIEEILVADGVHKE